MSKSKWILTVLIIVLMCTAVLLSIKLTGTDQISQFLSSWSTAKLVLSSSLIIGVLVLIYLFLKFEMWNKILSYYKLDLNGKFILRFNNIRQGAQEINNYQEFKDKLAEFQTEYDFLEYNIDYSANAVNIDLKTPQELTIKNGEDFLEKFVNDLNEMISLLSAEQIFIDLNINGRINNLAENIKFLVVNRNNQVGLNKTRYPNGILGKVINISN